MSLGTPPSPPVDRRTRRRQATDAKIAATVIELLRRVGPDGVTMDAVSAASGVAKTTLYRRYDDRYALLEAVAQQLEVEAPFDVIATGEAGLRELLRRLQVDFESRLGSQVVGRLLAADDEFMAQWRERLVRPRVESLRAHLERGAARRDLRADLDPQLIIEMIVGSAVVADAMRGGLPADWADQLAAKLWPTLAPAASA